MKLEKQHLSEVCKIGQGEECCRYLGCGSSGFSCLKFIPAAKAQLDFRVLTEDMTAQGDNCEGVS